MVSLRYCMFLLPMIAYGALAAPNPGSTPPESDTFAEILDNIAGGQQRIFTYQNLTFAIRTVSSPGPTAATGFSADRAVALYQDVIAGAQARAGTISPARPLSTETDQLFFLRAQRDVLASIKAVPVELMLRANFFLPHKDTLRYLLSESLRLAVLVDNDVPRVAPDVAAASHADSEDTFQALRLAIETFS